TKGRLHSGQRRNLKRASRKASYANALNCSSREFDFIRVQNKPAKASSSYSTRGLKFHFSLRRSRSRPCFSHRCADQASSPVKTFGMASVGGGEERICLLSGGSTSWRTMKSR